MPEACGRTAGCTGSRRRRGACRPVGNKFRILVPHPVDSLCEYIANSGYQSLICRIICRAIEGWTFESCWVYFF
jgi:hypothetical protein